MYFPDVFLNVFPLFAKPNEDQNTNYSIYLKLYLEYLASDPVKQFPGLDPLFVSSTRNSLKGTYNICKAVEAENGVANQVLITLRELRNKGKNALDPLIELRLTTSKVTLLSYTFRITLATL